jgi:tungstate transport system permease protein
VDYFFDALSSALTLILAADAEVYLIVWTSLKISLIAVTLAALVGVPLGLAVALNAFPGKTLLIQVLNTLMALMALPTVVIGLVLYGTFTRHGPLGELGLLYTQTAIVVGQCLLVLPIIWNLSISAAAGADPRLRDTCRSLGADDWQTGVMLFSEVRFALMAALVLAFGRAIGEVGIAMMLGGNIAGFTRTMTTAIALETSKGEFEFALALGLALLLVAFLVNGVMRYFQGQVR